MQTLAPALLDTHELAERLGVAVRSVKRWRIDGTGPRFVLIGKRGVRYRETDVAEWLAERERTSTALPVQPTRAA